MCVFSVSACLEGPCRDKTLLFYQGNWAFLIANYFLLCFSFFFSPPSPVHPFCSLVLNVFTKFVSNLSKYFFRLRGQVGITLIISENNIPEILKMNVFCKSWRNKIKYSLLCAETYILNTLRNYSASFKYGKSNSVFKQTRMFVFTAPFTFDLKA